MTTCTCPEIAQVKHHTGECLMMDLGVSLVLKLEAARESLNHRIASCRTTAKTHPDMLARERATARADAYTLALEMLR